MADVTFTGNLTAAPEMKFSNAGKPFANFTVAENYRKRNQNGEWEDSGTAFWRVTVFGYQAEAVADTLDKGMKVVVQGRGELREYTTKEGAPGKSLECVANHVGVVPRAPKNNNGGGFGQQQSSGQQAWGAEHQQSQPASDPWAQSGQTSAPF